MPSAHTPRDPSPYDPEPMRRAKEIAAAHRERDEAARAKAAELAEYREADPLTTTLPLHTEQRDYMRAAERAQREIREDVEQGIVPRDVPNFAALHDYVDANEYGGLCDEYGNHGTVFAAVVQHATDEWIKGGGLNPPRTILVHLNVEVPAEDTRSTEVLVGLIQRHVDASHPQRNAIRNLSISIALAEEA